MLVGLAHSLIDNVWKAFGGHNGAIVHCNIFEHWVLSELLEVVVVHVRGWNLTNQRYYWRMIFARIIQTGQQVRSTWTCRAEAHLNTAGQLCICRRRQSAHLLVTHLNVLIRSFSASKAAIVELKEPPG